MSRKTVQQQRAGATAGQNSNFHKKNTCESLAARVIAVCNQKGGCGKTTSVINIAAGLASLGKRVLVVDLDSQCNATSGLGGGIGSLQSAEGPTDRAAGSEGAPVLSSFDFMVNAGLPQNQGSKTSPAAAAYVMQTEYDNLYLMPGSIELSEFESRIASEIGRENKLKKALIPLRSKFDFILLDTPPSLGLISVNALNAASEVQIAMQAHPFALDGLNLLLETIELVKQELNPTLFVSGVYITMFDSRTRISQEIRNAVAEIPELKSRIFQTVIRQNVKVTEATQAKVPVMYYDMFCTGTQDYMLLSEEIAKQKFKQSETSAREKQRSKAGQAKQAEKGERP